MAQRSIGPLRVTACLAALLVQVMAATAAMAQQDPCRPQGSCPNAARSYSQIVTQPNNPRALPQNREEPVGRPDGDHGDGLGTLLEIFAGALIVFLVADALTGDWVSPTRLDADGPRFPVKQTLGKFQAQGYALAGWPVAIDLETLPGTTNWLEIADKNNNITRVAIEGEGRRVPVLEIPALAWLDRPTVARFTIQSTLPAENGRVRYQPLQIYGIAAGPRAVGSMTIAVTRFDPSETRQPDVVQYALRADRQFDRSAVEVLRLPAQGKSDLTLARDARLLPLTQGSHDGAWRMMTQRKPNLSGVYMLQARAWLVGGRNDERDWTGAFAPNFVRVP